jgi:hypothetical protein
MTELPDDATREQLLAELDRLREMITLQQAAIDRLFAMFKQPDPTPPKTELTVTDVARRLQRSRSWVYERMDAGDLPFSQISARRRIVRAQDLEAFLIVSRG